MEAGDVARAALRNDGSCGPSSKRSRHVCLGVATSFLFDVKRILVTGADGFAGGQLGVELLALRCEVQGMLREHPKPNPRLPACARFHVADLDDTAALRVAIEASQPDAII